MRPRARVPYLLADFDIDGGWNSTAAHRHRRLNEPTLPAQARAQAERSHFEKG